VLKGNWIIDNKPMNITVITNTYIMPV